MGGRNLPDYPRIIIIAGPNGAGKSTFAAEFLPQEAGCPNFVNADLIAAGLNPFRPERAAFRAGRLMLALLDGYAAKGETFAFETTLSGRGYARLIRQWQAQGCRVGIIYLKLPTPETAIARVRQRVSEGGHAVPEEVIRRRFHAGWHNFQTIYRPLVDEWAIYDSAITPPALLTRGVNQR